LSFALYWIGFAWSQYRFLLNGAILIASLLVCLGTVVTLWLKRPAREWC
jgi:hypothetical protein